MYEERVWELIAAKLSGEASEHDLAELDRLIREKPEISYQLEILLAFWGHAAQGLEKQQLKELKRQ